MSASVGYAGSLSSGTATSTNQKGIRTPVLRNRVSETHGGEPWSSTGIPLCRGPGRLRSVPPEGGLSAGAPRHPPRYAAFIPLSSPSSRHSSSSDEVCPDAGSLIALADAALYRAKRGGRNRAVASTPNLPRTARATPNRSGRVPAEPQLVVPRSARRSGKLHARCP